MARNAPIATARATKPISQSVPSRPFRSFAVEVARAPSRGAAEAATGAAAIDAMAKAYVSFAGSFMVRSFFCPVAPSLVGERNIKSAVSGDAAPGLVPCLQRFAAGTRGSETKPPAQERKAGG